MTTPQKTLTALALAALAGAGLYYARQASSLRAQARALQQQQAPLMRQIMQSQRERDDATNRLASLAGEIAKLGGNSTELLKLRGQVALLQGNLSQTNDPFVQTALAWQARKERLKRLFEERPDQRIPEMQFLTDQQWLDIAKNSDLTTEAGIGVAMSTARFFAHNDVAPIFQAALKDFMAANAGNLPGNISELKLFLDPPLDEAILDRYKVLSADLRQGWLEGVDVIEKSVVDKVRETVFAIGTNISTYGPEGPIPNMTFPPELIPAMRAFEADHPGQPPTDLFNDLKPYVKTPAQQTALENAIALWKKLPTMRANTTAP